MRRLGRLALAAGTLMLAACGSQAKTPTLAPAPARSLPTTSQTTPPSRPAATGTSTAPVTPSGGSEASSTRSAPEPAFASPPAQGEGLSAASATVRSLGYTPVSTSDYHPTQTLRVLTGTRAGSSDGHAQQAFFFVDGRYIGTDSREPSAMLTVVSQGDTEVTLAYALYRPGDAPCCPGAGQARVRFQLDNGKLAALDPIPPAHSSAGTSRK
jgi:LppP/LprE lipoprotein